MECDLRVYTHTHVFAQACECPALDLGISLSVKVEYAALEAWVTLRLFYHVWTPWV